MNIRINRKDKTIYIEQGHTLKDITDEIKYFLDMEGKNYKIYFLGEKNKMPIDIKSSFIEYNPIKDEKLTVTTLPKPWCEFTSNTTKNQDGK